MARQSGPLKVTGCIGDLSFYHDRTYGYLVRQKGGPSSDQVAKSPQFARTRENAAEFAIAARCGKLIRRAVWAVTGMKGDSTVTPRLASLLVRIGKLDVVSERGERSPERGLLSVEGRTLLHSFAFCGRYPIDRIFQQNVLFDLMSGTLTFGGSVSGSDFKYPKSATHVRITAAIVVFDFEAGEFKTFPMQALTRNLSDVSSFISLICDTPPEGMGTRMGVMAVTFLQEQNGELYVLQEGGSLGSF